MILRELTEYSAHYSYLAKRPQKYYLPENKDNVTNTVKNYRQFLPHFMPLVHPSPRNQLWATKNPWFEEQVIPELQILVKQIINKD